jgi:4-amino-4-deoxy-L-arabinose transferase-like glycosyltransferase
MTRKFSPLLVVLLVAWAFLTINLGSAWLGHQDANGAWISVAVRNYQWHGFFALGGLVDINTNPLGPVIPYVHHPPLMVWMMALPALLTGYSEALLRFVTASCTLLSIVAIYLLARRLAGEKYALWSAAFYSFTPMMTYFGRMPDHEAPALLVALLFGAVMVNWLRRPTRRGWWALVVLTVLSVWIAWGGLIVIALISLTALFYTRRRLSIVMLGVVALIALIAMLGYYLYFFNSTISDLLSAFVWRTSMNSLDPGTANFGWGEYLVRVGVRLITLYTPTITLLAIVGVVYALRGKRLLRALIAALTLGAVAYLLLFRNASYIHDYYLIYLAPAVALFAAYPLAFLPSRAPRYVRALIVSLALVTVMPLAVYLHFLYSGSDDPSYIQIGQVLNQDTQPQDLIVSNLPNLGMNIEFYAQRTVHWDIPPASVLAVVKDADTPAYFLHCGKDSTPPEMVQASDEVKITAACGLTRLH